MEVLVGQRNLLEVDIDKMILGRSNNFNSRQKFDFEIIRRKYANIMDILT